MSTHLFCCTTIQPTTLPSPEHEQTFIDFTKWAKWALNTRVVLTGSTDPSEASVCIQLVRQAINGPVEFIGYFIATDGNFEEVPENGILDANFVMMNERQSFRCIKHNRIFDLTLYEPSTGSTRHWRSSIAKPLEQIENALKNKMSGSGSQSVSGSIMRSMGSGGHRSRSGHGYGSGRGYGSGWGSNMGSGCGLDWGTGGSNGFHKNVPALTTTTTTVGCSDFDSDGWDQSQNQDQDPEISREDGTEDTDQDSDQDQTVPSSPMLGTQITPEDTEPYSFGTQVSLREEDVSQNYLNTEDYGCYYPDRSSDDYGSYDCGGDNDVSYDQDYGDYGDCGGCDD
ncbi:hypothetical protein N7491_000728 [Penicillium cf. griseofulvum]|uniref:Uncharacterized protein n=1 Tax=Penicillium cf. griseofulvum TaxID=2972120 RepID=A0A9W9IN67_9EURO|nr:hypothetical protein N7472_011133 [Penicillium cf. griseofulvum]KAJ5442888.1 hypothetical protein N7445_004639 [Penicillium cf. griseofulvum]KAJ5451546.1 hypothetical protein N7491_000728 [Penicillium cf. griseofulvum]